MPVCSQRDEDNSKGPRLPPDIQRLFGDAFVRSCELFEEYVFRCAIRVFLEVGLADACRRDVTTMQAIQRSRLDPGVAPVPVDWILRKLALRGVLTVVASDGNTARYLLANALPQLETDSILEEQSRLDPGNLPSYAMARLATEHYPAVLRGETTGEQVLFAPDKIGAWLDYFAAGNSIYAISNVIGAIAAGRAFPARGGAILELGGGLGSGAAALLDRLEASGRSAELASYRFTELAIPFLRRAQRTLAGRFAGRPLVFARLNMNEPFAAAGVAEGAHALVYGVNTLHVAHELAFTLSEIRRTLQPGGKLVLAECVRPFPGVPVYVEFVFNLLQAFRSPVLVPSWRPNGGFLTPEQWTGALEACGFTEVSLFPDIVALRDACPSLVVAAIVATRA
jgi:SAM-dependent methyltransferase